MRFGMEETRLSTTDGEMSAHARFRFLVRVGIEVKGGSLLNSSWRIDQRFSLGLRSGLFPGHSSFCQNPGKFGWHHCCVPAAVCTGASSCMKIVLTCLAANGADFVGKGLHGMSHYASTRLRHSWEALCTQLSHQFLHRLPPLAH